MIRGRSIARLALAGVLALGGAASAADLPTALRAEAPLSKAPQAERLQAKQLQAERLQAEQQQSEQLQAIGLEDLAGLPPLRPPLPEAAALPPAPAMPELNGEALRRLEEKLRALEATRFSPTTRLNVVQRSVIGGLQFSGEGAQLYRQGAIPGPNRQPVALPEAVAFNYDLRLNLDTSFTGIDLLRTQLRASNFVNGPWGAAPTLVSTLSTSFGVPLADTVEIRRLFYRTPLPGHLTLVAGPVVRQDDLLPLWPSEVAADRILALFQLNGAVGAYTVTTGPGGALWWRQARPGKPGWVAGLSYLAARGMDSDPSAGGLATAGSAAYGSAQLGYVGKRWMLAGIYTHIDADATIGGTPLVLALNPSRRQGRLLDNGYTEALGLGGYWKPGPGTGWPQVIVGTGWNRSTYRSQGSTPGLVPPGGAVSDSWSWTASLNWLNWPWNRSALGLSVGQPPYVLGADRSLIRRQLPQLGTSHFHSRDGVNNVVLELYLKLGVSDRITITPALFWAARPLGQLTPVSANSGQSSSGDGQIGVLGLLVQSTLRF